MKVKKGDQVYRHLNLAGFDTKEIETVLKVTKAGVYLDNGPGNDPSGPFDIKTGKHKDEYMSGSYIKEIK